MSKASNYLTTVDKRTNLSRKELIKEYIEPGLPVVLTDAALKWSGTGKITPEFFRSNYGKLVKEVDGKKYTVENFVELMLASTPENPAPYPFNLNVKDYFPELLDEMKPEILYSKSDRVNHPLLPKYMLRGTEVYELFLGGNGSFFPFLHIDNLALHTQITQLYGSKEFTLYSPEQTPYLYPRVENAGVSLVNIYKPDHESFSLFKNAVPTKVTIHQGETILFPTGWWHATWIPGPSISMGRVQLNANNWNAFVNDKYNSLKMHRPAIAVALLMYSKLLGLAMDLQEKFM